MEFTDAVVGDEVAWSEKYTDIWHTTTIVRLTKTKIGTADGGEWNRRSGWRWGASASPWGGEMLFPLNETYRGVVERAKEKQRRAGYISIIRKAKWDKLESFDLERLIEKIDEWGIRAEEKKE